MGGEAQAVKRSWDILGPDDPKDGSEIIADDEPELDTDKPTSASSEVAAAGFCGGGGELPR